MTHYHVDLGAGSIAQHGTQRRQLALSHTWPHKRVAHSCPALQLGSDALPKRFRVDHDATIPTFPSPHSKKQTCTISEDTVTCALPRMPISAFPLPPHLLIERAPWHGSPTTAHGNGTSGIGVRAAAARLRPNLVHTKTPPSAPHALVLPVPVPPASSHSHILTTHATRLATTTLHDTPRNLQVSLRMYGIIAKAHPLQLIAYALRAVLHRTIRTPCC